MEESFFSKSKNVKELTSKDFDGVATWKLKSKNCSVVLFYMNWCGYCKAVKDDWEKLGKTVLFMDILAVDCDKQKAHMSKIKEDMPELIKGYPTIVFYSNGQPVEQFSGERNFANLLKACMRVCQSS